MKRSVLVFYIVAFLLNAPALRTTADNLAFDNPLRKPLLSLLVPFDSFSQKTRLHALRATIERFERQNLE